MIGVEEARDVEIGADILNDDVRCIPPSPDRDITIRQRETFKCRSIRAAHDLEARPSRMRKGAGVKGIDAIEVGAQLVRDAPLSFEGAVGEEGSQRCPRLSRRCWSNTA